MNPTTFTSDIDIHRYEQQLERQESLLEHARIRPANRRLIVDFVNTCKVDPKIGASRLIRYAYCLRRIGELVDKPFRKMDDRDITEVLARIQQLKTAKGKPFSPATIQEFRKAISKFWRWLYFDEYNGEAPPAIRRVKGKESRGRQEPEIYTREEVQQIINAMTSPRNKAFYSCLYDLQCRVSELLTRRMKHVRYTDEGDVQILIEADKTMTRHWETLFESVGHFTTWMRLHPLPEEPDAPLWTVKKTNGNGARLYTHLGYGTARKLRLA